ncbi:MAG: acyl-CoA dehydrogenase [Peptococcaceae bacterium]|jgi:alkylation response protein AidB-like acyl-CoA dehydrogenase|nr:MAG: acyl-CoA dehydrogenase [Peptococcaceae bacterium]
MDFGFSEEIELLRKTVRKFLEKECPNELVRKWDEEKTFPYELQEKMIDIGLFALPFPEEYGGTNGTPLEFIIVAEEMGRKGYDIAGVYGLSLFNALTILHHGTEEQKRYYIPKVIKGEIRLSISVTEPDAGSDAGGIKTTAAQESDYFIINGQKVFSTGAHARNNIITLACRTDLNVSHHKGTSILLVDSDAPGVEIRRLDTLGRRIIGTNEIFFTDVKVSKDRLLGPLNGGWEVLTSGLEFERLFTCAAYVGNAQTVVDEALQYAKERVQFGRPIGNFQAIAHMLADMQTEVEAARLLTYRAAWMLTKGIPCLKEVSMAKLFGSETFVKAASIGMQILGGYGYMMEYNMQRYFRDARITTVTAGTSQIQRNIIARFMGLKPK